MANRVLVVVGGLLMVAGLTSAGDESALRAAGEGRAIYVVNCASCHGTDARGAKGPDLTTLGARNGGFNRLTVSSRIDGRRDGMQSEKMPAWCTGLQHTWPYGRSGAALETHKLVRYLETVQADTAAPLRASTK
jgi:mono/diheme cytochrome c family protein